jgi:hypothetical protein
MTPITALLQPSEAADHPKHVESSLADGRDTVDPIEESSVSASEIDRGTPVKPN